MSPPATPASPRLSSTAAVLALARRLPTMGRGRIIRATVLGGLAGLVEGLGVLALVPLLKLTGLEDAAVQDWRFPAALVGYVLLVAGGALLIRQRALDVQALSLDFLDRLRSDLHDAILNMEWSRFRSLRLADLQQSMTGEIGRIGQGVQLLGTLTSTLLTVPFVLIASFVLSWPLTLVALLVGGGIALATRRLGMQGFLLARDLGRANQNAMADLADDLAGLRLIKSFSAESVRASKIAGRFAAIRRNQMAYMRAMATERATLHATAATATALALYGAVSVLDVPPTEALVLIVAYARLLQVSLRGLSSWRQLNNATAALHAYDETLRMCRAAAEPTLHDAAQLPSLKRAVRLDGVSVSYAGESNDDAPCRPALSHIDAEIPVGRITALIGPSGAGKSTLTDLIAGLTTPDSGRILVDDTPLTPDTRAPWRRRVAVVPQDPFLFHDTIANNLRLSHPETTEDDMWKALEAASVADVVRALPEGLETVAGPRGARLSGGERQRIVLARALLRNPEVLVLDEATSSLDRATEHLVGEAIRTLRGRCTTLIVAHRLDTIRHADTVLLLDDGRLVAAGPLAAIRDDVERVLGL